MIWINRYHKGFNRFWLVLSLLASLFVWFVDDAGTGIKTFAVCFVVGHIGFIVVWWIIRGFR